MIKAPDLLDNAGETALAAGMRFLSGDSGGALASVFSGIKGAYAEKQAHDYLRENNHTEAEVTVWSGCKDDQTVRRAGRRQAALPTSPVHMVSSPGGLTPQSADTTEEGQATGAMSYGFLRSLEHYPRTSLIALLNNIRDEMHRGGYSQKPQFSSGKRELW